MLMDVYCAMDVPRPVSVLVFFVLLFLPVLCKGVHLLYHFGEKNWRLAIHNCFFRSCFFLHFVDLVDFVDLVGSASKGLNQAPVPGRAKSRYPRPAVSRAAGFERPPNF